MGRGILDGAGESGWIIVPTTSLIGVDWTSACMIVGDNPVISYFGFSPKRNTTF